VAYAIEPDYNLPVADLAMLLLEAPVVGVTPVPLATRRPRPGTVGTIVGYGTDGRGNLGVKEMGTVAASPALTLEVCLPARVSRLPHHSVRPRHRALAPPGDPTGHPGLPIMRSVSCGRTQVLLSRTESWTRDREAGPRALKWKGTGRPRRTQI